MKLYYVHDPMCSWCWAFRPIYLLLKDRLPKQIEFIRLLGGLAPDSDAPMPEATKQYVISNWHQIQHELPNTQFNYDFWKACQPRRSTYPACRAVIAARHQGEHFDELMTHAIQHAYYLNAKNPSESDTLIELSENIGCDKIKFENDLNASRTETILKEELSTARSLNLNSFPGLLYISETISQHIPIDYHDVDKIVANINLAINR